MKKPISREDALNKVYLVKRSGSSCYVSIPITLFGEYIMINIIEKDDVYKEQTKHLNTN